MPINQPSGQIRLTNVAVVRLKRGGKRFEIACYKNKVKEFRQGIEKDLSEVLQIDSVFTNVSRGQTASSNELEKSFKGFATRDDIVKEILVKGEFQEGEKERQYHLDNLRREIITMVAERTINPDTGHPHPTGMIDKAMNEVHFNVSPTKPAKGQALDVIKLLQQQKTLPIHRAMMRIRLIVPLSSITDEDSDDEGENSFKAKIKPHLAVVEEDETTYDEWEIVAKIETGSFKVINELIQSEIYGNAKLETISFAAAEADPEGNR